MRPMLAGLALCCGLLALVACSSRPVILDTLTRKAGPRVNAADFRAAPGAQAANHAAPTPSPSAPAVTTVAPGPSAGAPTLPNVAANQPRLDPLTIDVVPGAPDLTGAPPPPVETPALLDEKVGDVNGRPIYASAFLAPLEAQFIAEARDYRRAEWVERTRTTIARQLAGFINDQLLRAEALESLPVQTREVGLQRFLDSRRDTLRSQAGGSLTEAQRRLLAERGITVEQWLRELEDEQLIRISIQGLAQDVQISARDIQAYYDRNQEEFKPPPTARFYEIVVSTSNTNARQQIEEALAAGTPFTDLAAGPLNASTFRREGGLRTAPLTGDYASTNLFNNDALNQAAWGLTPGRWAGPILYGNNNALTSWIYLDSIVSTGRTLYEVQTEITERLRRAELRTRHEEMVTRLRERASFTSESIMVRRLLEIALARYYPPGQPEPAQPRQPTTTPTRRP